MKKSLIILIYAALALSTLLIFWQVRNFDFINYDDAEYVYENPHVYNGLSFDGIIWAFKSTHAANWHPLTWLSLMADCHLFGKNPGAIHFINLIFHILNTLLLFSIFKKVIASIWPSAFIAAVFAIHPMHVESVAWIAERKDVLSTLFLLLTIAAYIRYTNRRIKANYILTLLLYILGLLAKPMLVTLPFLLLLLDYWPLNRFALLESSKTKNLSNLNNRQALYTLVYEKFPFFVLAFNSCIVTFLVQRAGGAIGDVTGVPWQNKIENAFLSYFTYVNKLFWPRDLAIIYPLDSRMIQPWQAIICSIALIVISILVIYFGRKRKYLTVGWFWYLGTLVPVIGLIQVGSQSHADRYTYIPYIGLLIMIAWGMAKLSSKWKYQKMVVGSAAVILLCAMGTTAFKQVSHWKNSFTVFNHALEVTKNNYIAYYSLGVAYAGEDRWQEAIAAYEETIRIKPDYYMAYNNLANAYGRLGNWQKEIECCENALKIKSKYPQAYYNLGMAYGGLGLYDKEVEMFKQAIKLKQDYVEAISNLGAAYSLLGRNQDAMEFCKKAIDLKPNYTEAHYNLGVVYAKMDQFPDAVKSFKQALQIDPNYIQAHYNLGVVYKSLNQNSDAINSFKQAVKFNPNYDEAHFNLGIEYLKTGKKDLALEEYKILKNLNPELANSLFAPADSNMP